MANEPFELAWNLFVELRKEILESQKLRAQIIGLKITLVSGALGYLLSHQDTVRPIVLTIPAFAAVFFDLLINSYSFSIKRLGVYCYEHLEERVFKSSVSLPADFLLWQDFLRSPQTQQRFSVTGNIGLTALAAVPAVYGLFADLATPFAVLGTVALVGLVLYDLNVFIQVSLRRRLAAAGTVFSISSVGAIGRRLVTTAQQHVRPGRWLAFARRGRST